MTVDMKKAVKGATVWFRCGGSAVVSGNPELSVEEVFVYLGDENGQPTSFFLNGSYSFGSGHPLDIVKIDPPAFDWADVKPGMAFKVKSNNDLVFYVGPHMASKNKAVFYIQKLQGYKYNDYELRYLTRAQEYDIEVMI